MKSLEKTLWCVAIFAVAMAFLESAVVIYLREIYYKEGFNFPLKPLPFPIARVEILREAATIFMLIAIGYLSGKTKLQRFAYFIFAFAVWDIFYYLFLYIFLGWPQSLFTWDILFLIPLPWVGPVWAPCLLSLLMIVGSLPVISEIHKRNDYVTKKSDWVFLIGGAAVCIFSFMWDYIVISANSVSYSADLFSNLHNYIPQSFNHPLFFTGFALMSFPVFSNLIVKSKPIHP
jgi:hypothetical protein